MVGGNLGGLVSEQHVGRHSTRCMQAHTLLHLDLYLDLHLYLQLSLLVTVVNIQE